MTAVFPELRLRRPRMHTWSRRLFAEHRLHADDLILPLFVHEEAAPTPIAAMPGVFRFDLTNLVAQARRAQAAGLPALALFPVTPRARKCPYGKEALNPDNLTCRAIAAIKQAVPGIGVIADVALDPYTSHGQDGVLDAQGQVDNDATLEVLAQQAVVLARSGADMVAPSDMMDGRIAAVRHALDSTGFTHTMILSYAAKYASAFYGPFREAVGSAGALQGDKKTYQMDPANAREARREVALDVGEGADALMIKPGLPYLDILADIAQRTDLPVFAYQVSGEYSMIQAAHAQGWVDGDAVMRESLLALKRAGARAILTYAALSIAENTLAGG